MGTTDYFNKEKNNINSNDVTFQEYKLVVHPEVADNVQNQGKTKEASEKLVRKKEAVHAEAIQRHEHKQEVSGEIHQVDKDDMQLFEQNQGVLDRVQNGTEEEPVCK